MEFNGTFLATIISFLVFVFLMNKILYVPMRKIVNERREVVEGNYSAAAENDKKAEELVTEREEKLVGAKDEARRQYNELLDGFKAEKSEIIQSAQEKSKTELEEAYKDLNNVSNNAKESLKGSMNDFANDIVEKVLGYRSEIQGFDNETVDKILYNQEG
ncbi:ATP synthase F0 subunit B [bacterium]|nr:ATP synthase F0 subunit B [bacterium]